MLLIMFINISGRKRTRRVGHVYTKREIDLSCRSLFWYVLSQWQLSQIWFIFGKGNIDIYGCDQDYCENIHFEWWYFSNIFSLLLSTEGWVCLCSLSGCFWKCMNIYNLRKRKFTIRRSGEMWLFECPRTTVFCQLVNCSDLDIHLNIAEEGDYELTQDPLLYKLQKLKKFNNDNACSRVVRNHRLNPVEFTFKKSSAFVIFNRKTTRWARR